MIYVSCLSIVKTNKVFLFLFLVCMIVVLVWQAESVFTLQALKNNIQSLIEYKESNFILFVIIYFVIYVLSTVLSVPGAAILTLAGGALFGLVNGTILVSFASSIGALLAFLHRDVYCGHLSRISSLNNIRKSGPILVPTNQLIYCLCA